MSNYELEMHRNALDLNFRHIEGFQYKLPASWQGNDFVIDLETSGKEQHQILINVAKQLAVENKRKSHLIAKLEGTLEGYQDGLLEDLRLSKVLV